MSICKFQTPMLFLVGAPKCGTTSLADCLAKERNIGYPGEKEINFFSRSDVSDLYYANQYVIRDRSAYLDRFPRRSGIQYNLDASVSYFDSDQALFEISSLKCRKKVIILLRDPVSRAASHFTMDVTSGYLKGITFSELIRRHFPDDNDLFSTAYHQVVGLGFYFKYVCRWQQTIGACNVHVASLSEMVREPTYFFDQLSSFLGFKLDSRTLESRNTASAPRNFLLAALYRSPARRALRHRLPEEWRRKLKSLVFVSAPSSAVSDDDHRFLRRVYADDSAAIKSYCGIDLLAD